MENSFYQYLRCEVVVPSGFRRGRVPVQIRQAGTDTLEILPVRVSGEATHQILCVGGLPLITHLPEADATISGEIGRNHYWELAETFALVLGLQPGQTFVDAGANLGYYSVLASHVLQANGQVYAVEPDRRNYLVLAANLLLTKQLFPHAAPALAIPQALSDRAGNARLFQYDQNLGLHSLVAQQGAIHSTVVACTTLDDLRFAPTGPGVINRTIDMLKADIQGSELPMLQGATRTLAHDRPLLVLEFEPYLWGDESCLALLTWLGAQGYLLFRVFHANHQDPQVMLSESLRLLSSDEVAELVQKKMIGPYGTLIAYPEQGPVARGE